MECLNRIAARGASPIIRLFNKSRRWIMALAARLAYIAPARA
jgi:hypothetical protein